MTWLNAALAFAVTMLILSMSISVLVETVHRCVGLREKGLRLMMHHLYERVVGPLVESRSDDNPEKLKKDFVDLMTVNRAPAGVAGGGSDTAATTRKLADDAVEMDAGLIGTRIWSGRRLSGIHVNDFMSRLGGSDFGGLIDTLGPDPARQFRADLVAKFEQFGAEASEFFERRARLLSVAIALALAYCLYVQPFELFTAYLNPENAKITQSVMDMAPGALGEFASRRDAVSAAEDKVAKERQALDAARKADTRNPSDSGKQAVKSAQDDLATAETDMEAALGDLQKQVKDLQVAGAPIGWTSARLKQAGFFMLGDFLPLPDFRQANALHTLLWLIAGGLLIGLGGPFWYDMVNALTNIRSLFGVATTPAPKPGQADDGSTAETPAGRQTSSASGPSPKAAEAYYNAAADGRAAVLAAKLSAVDDYAVG